jgi:DNA-binding transcriptional LysR family regulator
MASCGEALASGALVRVLPAWSGIDGILHVVFVSRRGMLPSIRTVIDCVTEALKSEASD